MKIKYRKGRSIKTAKRPTWPPHKGYFWKQLHNGSWVEAKYV